MITCSTCFVAKISFSTSKIIQNQTLNRLVSKNLAKFQNDSTICVLYCEKENGRHWAYVGRLWEEAKDKIRAVVGEFEKSDRLVRQELHSTQTHRPFEHQQAYAKLKHETAEDNAKFDLKARNLNISMCVLADEEPFVVLLTAMSWEQWWVGFLQVVTDDFDRSMYRRSKTYR